MKVVYKIVPIVKADPGPLPITKMELFLKIVYSSNPYIKAMSHGVPP